MVLPESARHRCCATALFEAGGNITEAQQFDEVQTGRFFMRVVLSVASGEDAQSRLQAGLEGPAFRFSLTWNLHDHLPKRRMIRRGAT